MENQVGGKLRWVLILIFGIPVATILLYAGQSFINDHIPSFRTSYALICIVIYMISMRVSVKKMASNRRLSDDFINSIISVWSIWTFFTLCPVFMVTIMPNFFGKILSFLLCCVLWVINMLITIDRCPKCRNPKGLEHYKDEELDEVIVETSDSGSVSRSMPQHSDTLFGERIEQNVKYTDSYHTKKYQAVKSIYKCKECGALVDRGTFKGKLIESTHERVTRKEKQTTDFI